MKQSRANVCLRQSGVGNTPLARVLWTRAWLNYAAPWMMTRRNRALSRPSRGRVIASLRQCMERGKIFLYAQEKLDKLSIDIPASGGGHYRIYINKYIYSGLASVYGDSRFWGFCFCIRNDDSEPGDCRFYDGAFHHRCLINFLQSGFTQPGKNPNTG